MLTLSSILVPRDFSHLSDQATQAALELARRTGATVHVLFAEVLHADMPEAGPDANRTRLKQRLLEGLDADVPLVPVVVRDMAAAPAIVAYAEAHDIDLIVLGTHGRRGLSRLLMGSTAEEVVRTAPCPVLTFRGQEEAPASTTAITKVLVPIDFSRHAREALRQGRALAALYGARLDLLHVVEEQLHPAFYNYQVGSIYDIDPKIDEKATAELQRFFEATPGPEVDVALHVRHGHPARQITAFAEEQATSLIVMSTHGLRGLDHFLLGSVAEKVVRRTTCPVLTLKSFGKPLVDHSDCAAASEA